ncbi:MAG TPA: DNA alkylation repair protein [Patescibacteria group bacterium]|nr:DNA alkylation repair protein [Patescibacteria group bacterium]
MYEFNDVLAELKSLADAQKAKGQARFFKSGPGEYGEGDKFWGITVPQIRSVVKKYKDLPLKESEKLLQNEIHEVRLCAVLLLVQQYKNDPENVYKIYSKNTKNLNNWDIIDLSAEYIVGPYLEHKSKSQLTTFANSKSLWERRIAMISTFYYIYHADDREALRIATILLYDKQDLIQKAVGWMLREVGKRCSEKDLEHFLDSYAHDMPRTTLRYAIERMSMEKKKHYMEMRTKEVVKL